MRMFVIVVGDGSEQYANERRSPCWCNQSHYLLFIGFGAVIYRYWSLCLVNEWLRRRVMPIIIHIFPRSGFDLIWCRFRPVYIAGCGISSALLEFNRPIYLPGNSPAIINEIYFLKINHIHIYKYDCIISYYYHYYIINIVMKNMLISIHYCSLDIELIEMQWNGDRRSARFVNCWGRWRLIRPDGGQSGNPAIRIRGSAQLGGLNTHTHTHTQSDTHTHTHTRRDTRRKT